MIILSKRPLIGREFTLVLFPIGRAGTGGFRPTVQMLDRVKMGAAQNIDVAAFRAETAVLGVYLIITAAFAIRLMIPKL